jgi:hypothetical protein
LKWEKYNEDISLVGIKLDGKKVVKVEVVDVGMLSEIGKCVVVGVGMLSDIKFDIVRVLSEIGKGVGFGVGMLCNIKFDIPLS